MDCVHLSSVQKENWRDMQPFDQQDNLLVGNVLVEVLSSQFRSADLNCSFHDEKNINQSYSYNSEETSDLAAVKMLGVAMPCRDSTVLSSNYVKGPSVHKQIYQQTHLECPVLKREVENEEIEPGIHTELREQCDSKFHILSPHLTVEECSKSARHCSSAESSDHQGKALLNAANEEAHLMNSSSCTFEEVTSSQGPNSSTSRNLSENFLDLRSFSSDHFPLSADRITDNSRLDMSTIRDRKKRKRTRVCKNSEEVESQRMTHIAVERNRRKQMNEHLGVLRSLMPGSYIQRGDQASIIGGAIEFVKELEEVLHSLQAQKRKRDCDDGKLNQHVVGSFVTDFILNPQWSFSTYESAAKDGIDFAFDQCRELISESNSSVADVEVKMIGLEAEVKILSQRRHGQLLKALSAIESLHLKIMHLNITTIEQTVLYSFNVKVGVDCQLHTGGELAIAIQQIFRLIHSSSRVEEHSEVSLT